MPPIISFVPAVVVLLGFLASGALAQNAVVEEEWVAHDSTAIARLVRIVRDQPQRLLELDAFRRIDFEDLGYGYSYHESFTEGSYVATRLQIVLKGGTPVAFAVTPRLPFPYTDLYDRYRGFYAHPFTFDSGGNPRTYFWNYRTMTLPVGDSVYMLRFQRQVFKHPLREKLEWLMTPFSGIEYGCGTRASNTMPPNRQLFEEVAPALNYLLATCLMRSVNPAVRLTAIEYLQRFHPDKFVRRPMQKDVKKILRSHPRAVTLEGYERSHESSEALVARFVRESCMTVPMPAAAMDVAKAEDESD
jgi:hypothetical protein